MDSALNNLINAAKEAERVLTDLTSDSTDSDKIAVLHRLQDAIRQKDLIPSRRDEVALQLLAARYSLPGHPLLNKQSDQEAVIKDCYRLANHFIEVGKEFNKDG